MGTEKVRDVSRTSRSKIWSKLLSLINNLYLILKFTANNTGSEYGISHLQKLKLARRIIQNIKKTSSLTSWQQNILLIEEIIGLPKSLKGDVVECGCYEGASTANLSLACALTNRRLIVCDSFEGLPKPKDDEKYEINAGSIGDYYIWEEGEFSTVGGLDTVKRNVSKFGNIKVCQFVKGYFEDTLKDIDSESIVLVFEDADVRTSVEDCLRHLWPKLQEGCKFFSHEPWSVNVVSLFFDKKWWQDNLKAEPPGFDGSGRGIIAGLSYSMVGYAKKFDAESIKKHGKKKVHLGSKGFET
jgi:O-methyltransferase